MKKISFLVLGISIVVCISFLLRTRDIVQVKQSIDDCLELEKKLAAEGGTPEEWQRALDCQAEQAGRLGLDTPLPEDAFLGDELNAPEGSYAYFHGFGQNDSIAVFDDRVEFKSQIGYPSGLQTIPFTRISEITLDQTPIPTIVIGYTGEDKMNFNLSVSLYKKGNPLLPNANKYAQALFNLLNELHRESEH